MMNRNAHKITYDYKITHTITVAIALDYNIKFRVEEESSLFCWANEKDKIENQPHIIKKNPRHTNVHIAFVGYAVK